MEDRDAAVGEDELSGSHENDDLKGPVPASVSARRVGVGRGGTGWVGMRHSTLMVARVRLSRSDAVRDQTLPGIHDSPSRLVKLSSSPFVFR